MAELQVMIAVRPAEVVALVDPEQLLRRLLGILRVVEEFRPILSQLVTAVLRAPQLAVRREGHAHGVANPGGVPRPTPLRLIRRGCVEAPDSRPGGELGTRILARRFDDAVVDLTRVRRRADVDEQRPAIWREREVPRAVPARGQVLHDHVRRAQRGEASRPHGVAIHGGRRAGVQHPLSECDTRAALAAKALPHVGLAVARGVPQGEHAPRAGAPAGERDEHVAVRGHSEVPGRAHLIGDHDRAEAVGEREARVAGIAGGQPDGRAGRQ